MSVQHFPRNSTVPIPIDVPLYSGTVPLSGEAANLSLVLICLENGYTLDHTDNVFRTGAVLPGQSLVAFTDYSNDYSALIVPSGWARGHYRGHVHHSISGQDFNFDFTIGLFVERRLGLSAAYINGYLTISMWVEEGGVIQTDYTSLQNAVIMNSAGVPLVDGVMGNNSSPTSGIFQFIQAVNLAASTSYIVRCDAHAPAPATISPYVFTLANGLARP
jgi:hypothetical protein